MLSGDAFWMHYAYLLRFPPGLHRLVTSFMMTGPQLSVLFDTYFVYTYLSQLEQTKFTRKEDLIWYLMVVGSIIIVGAFSFVLPAYSVACFHSRRRLHHFPKHNVHLINLPA